VSESITVRKQEDKTIKIAHYPYYKNYHSYDNYSRILSEIENEACKVVRILDLPPYQGLGSYSKL